MVNSFNAQQNHKFSIFKLDINIFPHYTINIIKNGVEARRPSHNRDIECFLSYRLKMSTFWFLHHWFITQITKLGHLNKKIYCLILCYIIWIRNLTMIFCSSLSKMFMQYCSKFRIPKMHRQFFEIFLSNPEYVEVFCKIRSNPFHFARRKWIFEK